VLREPADRRVAPLTAQARVATLWHVNDDNQTTTADGSSSSTSTEGVQEPVQRPSKRRGFAAMDRALVAEIARKGGRAAHEAGTAHEFTSDEARAAGRKGGRATHANRRAAKS